MIKTKRMIGMLLAGTMVFGASGSVYAGESAPNNGETYKLAILSFDVSGAVYEASCAYMDYLGEQLGFTYDYVSAGYSSQEQINTAETYLSQGYRGLIINNDLGSAEAILDLCEDYDAYLGGYYTDFANSIYASGTPNTSVLENPRFVGSAIDGAVDYSGVAREMFRAIVLEDGNTKVGMATMPMAWYPTQITTGVSTFVQLVEEYNAGEMKETDGVPVTLVQTRTDDDGNPVYYEAVDGESMSFSSSFFINNDMTACASFAATDFTYGALLESKADVGLYATGWQDQYVDDFGSNGRIKMIATSPIESIIYPVAQILDKLNGNSYPDELTGEAAFGKIVPTDVIFNVGDEGLLNFEKSLHFTKDASTAYFSADDVKNLMVTYNSDATHEALAKALNNGDMTIEALAER